MEGIFFQDDRFAVFSSAYENGQDKNSLFVRTYGMSDLVPQMPLKRIHSISAESRNDNGRYEVEERTAGEGFQVRVKGSGLEKDDMHRKMLLFSNGLELESEQDENYILPYPPEQFDIEDVVYTEDGSKVMVGRLYAEKQEKRSRKREGKPTFDMVLLTYPSEGGQPQTVTIPAGDRFLQDMTLLLPADGGDIQCAGFWGSKGSWSVRGAYYMHLDRTSKEVTHQSFKEFDNDFITAYMTEKEEKKATKKAERKGEDVEMYEYDLDRIVQRDDGGAVLIGEQYYMYVITTISAGPNGGTSTNHTNHYIYNDIIAINISPEGDIEWAAKVPKRQHTRNDGGRYSSYAMTIKNDKIYLVFNDSGENLMLLPGQKVHQFELRGKEALITLATIDADGHVHREALLALDKRDAYLMPKECFQMEDDRMFIYAIRKKEYRYGMITFE